MKKFLSSFLVAIAVLCMSNLFAQEVFVSTTPANKNVIMEELTGMYCGICPRAHKITHEYMMANPGRAFVINIHAGSYAQGIPNYQTPFGSALLSLFNPGGYPSVGVNRHAFSGTSILVPQYTNTATYANTIKNQESYCNVAARATYDMQTREISVRVQVYFTRSGAPATMKLNVALLQDSILGPQSGASSNPDQVVGDQYRHMHMLRHLLTGQWGLNITNTTQGSLVDTVVTYTLPQHLNNIPYVEKDLSILAFIAESNKEIITGNHANIQFLNSKRNDLTITGSEVIDPGNCKKEVKIKFQNRGSLPITQANLKFLVNNEAYTQTFTGNIRQFAFDEFSTGPIDVPLNEDVEVRAILIGYNDTVVNDTFRHTLRFNEAHSTLTIQVKSDAYSAPYTSSYGQQAGEQSWKLFGPSGQVIASKTPSDFTASTLNTFTVTATGESGCYRFELKDSYGDGIDGGFFRIKDANGIEIAYSDGNFESSVFRTFYWDGIVAVADFEMSDGIVIYPNPARDFLNVVTENRLEKVEIYNLQGQRVMVSGADTHIPVQSLSNGMYVVRVFTDKGVTAMKFNKQ